MSTLSARYVKQPRKHYVCDWCERSITGPYIRLYGSAHETEKPWMLRLHPTVSCCPNMEMDRKIADAMRKAKEGS